MAGIFQSNIFQHSVFQVGGQQPVPVPSFGGGGGSAGYTRPFVHSRPFTPTKVEKKKRKKERKIIRAELAQMMEILAPHEMPAPGVVRNGSLLNPQIVRAPQVVSAPDEEEEEEVAMLLLAA